MENKVEKILAKYQKAKDIKNSWNTKYEEVAKYIMPSKYQTKNKDGSYSEKDEEIYTSVGQNAANNFVNKIQSIITPINSDFIGLEAGDFRPDKEEQDINLDKLCKLINNFKNASNFDSVIAEFYYELILGTACLLVQGGGFRSPLTFKVIPFYDYCITEGCKGIIDGVFREMKVKPTQIKYVWEDTKYEPTSEEKDKDAELNVLECTLYNYETNKYDYHVILLAKKQEIVKREYTTNPFIILRWGKTAGDIYGRGVGISAISDIKTLNTVLEYSLRAFAFNVPTFLVERDGILNEENFELTPGALNYVKSTASNNPSIMPLDVKTDHNIASYNIDRMSMDIKRTMMDSTIPDNPNDDMTATEINRRVAELNVNLTSMFGRINNDFLVPLTKRIIEVLQEYAYIDRELDVNVIDGFGYKIKINTPLAKQNKQTELDAAIQAIQMMVSLDQTGQILNQYVKVNELVPYMLDLAGMPNRFIKTKDEIEAEQQMQIQAQQQAQLQDMQNQVLLSNEIEKGKEDAKRGY